MVCSSKLIPITEIEPHAHQDYIVPESVQFHVEWYMEHGEFIDPLVLEVGGERCERRNIEALLIDGNHRLYAARCLGLESVLVKIV